MGKSRLIVGVLVVVCAILCMFTIYKHTQYNSMRIAYNIKDRESITLKEDYEKLYRAYYEYDKKVLEILKFSDKVYWAEDSSAYIIKANGTVVFSFFKKPKMDEEFYLWCKYYGPTGDGINIAIWINYGRVDTLKSHQFIKCKSEQLPETIFAAPFLPQVNRQPYEEKLVSKIILK